MSHSVNAPIKEEEKWYVYTHREVLQYICLVASGNKGIPSILIRLKP